MSGTLPTPGVGPLNASQPHREDALEYLHCSTIAKYRKGQAIYSGMRASHGLYLIVDGIVQVASRTPEGAEVVLDIYAQDEFFGESSLIDPVRPEEAIALQPTSVMQWSAAEIEDNILRQPRLGVALMQMAIARSIGFRQRIASFALDSMGQRLARGLLGLGARLGVQNPDGSIDLTPLTHELLARYIGTSREIITNHMTQFRRLGCVAYSRRGITLQPRALNRWLADDGTRQAGGPALLAHQPSVFDGMTANP